MYQPIETPNAPGAIGPYSQGIRFKDIVYSSGQLPCDPQTGEICGGTIAEQTERAIANLRAVLEAAGASLDTTIKTTCFLADMGDFAEFNRIYATHFSQRPARSCIAARALPKGVLVEVEAVAHVR